MYIIIVKIVKLKRNSFSHFIARRFHNGINREGKASLVLLPEVEKFSLNIENYYYQILFREGKASLVLSIPITRTGCKLIHFSHLGNLLMSLKRFHI